MNNYLILFILMIFTSQLSRAQKIDNMDAEGSYDVIIVGGGLSGLTAGFELRDKKLLVLEKKDVAGGRIISGEWEGFHYPKGTEYMGEPHGMQSRFFKKLGLRTIEIPPPTDGIAYGNKIYYAENILNFLSEEAKDQFEKLNEELNTLDKDFQKAIWWKQGQQGKFASYDSLSMGQWLQANNYDALIQQYFDVENRGLFGASSEELSFLFNTTEMAYNSPSAEEVYESETYTFPNGMIDLSNALSDALGDRLLTGAAVTNVKVNKEGIAEVTYTKNGISHTVLAKSVIMATPAPVTNWLVSEGLSEVIRERLKSVLYSQYITMNLFTTERLFKEAWTISCLDNYFVTMYDVIRTQVADDYQGKSITSFYIAPEKATDQTFIDRTDEEIYEGTMKDLKVYFPEVEAMVLGYDIQRFKYAYPVFTKNYHEVINDLNSDKSVRGPLFLAGDYTFFATIDGAMASGWKSAKRVKKYLKK